MFRTARVVVWSCVVVGFLAGGLRAQQTGPAEQVGSSLETVERYTLPPVDVTAVALEDAQREVDGLPPRFAIPHAVSLTPADHGTWESIPRNQWLWRLRIESPGALSLNLGFTRFRLPSGGQLRLYSADRSQTVRPFTAADNQDHGQLWTPVVLTDDLIVELIVPQDMLADVDLELGSINVGYRFFGEIPDPLRSGWCNVDVVCPEGDGWRNEIPAVAVISTGGSTFCTGFMVNNTAEDEAPYFMTANHCGINSGNASSLVTYWNFQSPTCGQHGGGSLSQFQTGSTFKAAYSGSDFTLVRLNSNPNPAWGVTYAGWDRGTQNPTSAVAIHHPNTDEKSISFENQACTTTSYLGTSTPGDGTHVRVADWDVGTTEPGSSGSPLFDQNHRVVGQLHGGYAACGNNDSDWYGRFSRSWTGNNSNTTRLSNWLDPGNTGAQAVDTFLPWAIGLKITPEDGLNSSGNSGGPFSPSSVIYTLENQGDTGLNYTVSSTQSWVYLSSTGGYLAGGTSTTVTVSIDASAAALGDGEYADLVSFVNTTDHEGDTTRPVSLQVGVPQAAYSFPLDSNPGWSTTGAWAFGQPLGLGSHNRDPSAGHTGSAVYGYNLGGDYANNLSARYLTTTALNCSGLSQAELRFWRWLGVERFDQAKIEASNNGTTWVTLWANPGATSLSETAWTQQVLDLSAVADGQSTVFIRWSLGPTDSSVTYPGWNIDDVEIWGYVDQAGTCSDGALNQGETRIDCGGPCAACACTADAACSNGDFCDGAESCDAWGQCQAGAASCGSGTWCDEAADTCQAYGTGDFDADGDVDLEDFAAFQGCFGELGTGICQPGNLSGTGLIDAADYAGFAGTLAGPQ